MSDLRRHADAFLHSSGWGAARRVYLAGDASDRSYDRLHLNGKTAVLMDAPPGQGEDPAQFLTIAAHLAGLGLSAPTCIASDLAHGFLLLEDLGDAIYARQLQDEPSDDGLLYGAAVDVLVHLQAHAPCANLPDLSAQDWSDAAAFALDWYRFAITGDTGKKTNFTTALCDLLQRNANGTRVMILRDFHAENLLWLPERPGLARVGLLDFQLAQLGQPAYDLVSLLQDARRDVPQETERAMKLRFVAAAGVPSDQFEITYAVLGAQRALRIIGVFARLCLVAGKPAYLPLIPRVWAQLHQNLAIPALAPLAELCAELLPPPTPAVLAIIGSKCGHYR